MAVAEWANALLHNGLGNYPVAMAAAVRALEHQEYPGAHYPGVGNWAAAELIEAAMRCGRPEVASEALHWLSEMSQASGTNWARGVEARAKALLAVGDAAEASYRESIDWLQQSRAGTELARAHLLYGEWLRRENRRTDARKHLRVAVEMLEKMGMEGFAARARHELTAAGGASRKRSTPMATPLTAQEAMIARHAGDGLSNPEIASRLFISARTVQYHLSKVFAKLDITSRGQLKSVLSDGVQGS